MSAATMHPVPVSQELLAHPIYQAACALAAQLAAHGHQVLFVGGFVRDLVRRSRAGDGPWPATFDIDVATSADPSEIRAVFRTAHFVGQMFGVSMVDQGPYCFELATFRSEGRYSDGRRPDFVTKGSLEADAARRDFSINALYFDPAQSVILDFHDGVADIGAGVLRTVGDPKKRFEEDHLRIIRMCRFAAALDFEVAPETWNAATLMAHAVTILSRERILIEIKKTPPSGVPRFLSLLHQLGVDRMLWQLTFDRVPVWFEQPSVLAELKGLLDAEAHHPMSFVLLASWRHALSLSQVERDVLENELKQWPATVADRRLLQGLCQLLRLMSSTATQHLLSDEHTPVPARAALVWLTSALHVLQKLGAVGDVGLRILCSVACGSCPPDLRALCDIAIQAASSHADLQGRKDIVMAVQNRGLDPRWIGVLDAWGRLRAALEGAASGLECVVREIDECRLNALTATDAYTELLISIMNLNERARGPRP